MSKQQDPSTIMMASAIASVLSTIFSNPFEVLKIRQQSAGMHCDVHEVKPQNPPQFKYIHEVALNNQLHNHTSSQPIQRQFIQYLSKVGLVNQISNPKTNPFIRIYHTCTCLTSDSLLQAISQIYKREGPKTFFNGWRYAVMQAGASNVCYFSFYEKSKVYLTNQHLPDSRFLMPLLASTFSRAVTTTITFPLEYWKVLQSSTVGYTTKKNLQLGTRIHSAYLITIQRDVIFSCIYWPLLENIKLELTRLNKLDKASNIINLLSGVTAGCITALVTLPLDVVKTQKQVSTRLDRIDSHGQRSTLTILRGIYSQEGLSGLFRGVQPRIAKVTVHSGMVYMMYEYLKDLIGRQ